MLNDDWELIKTVTAEYSTCTDFDLSEIIEDYNNDNNSTYKLEDIKDIWIKRNVIHIIMNDDTEVEYSWDIPDSDYKRPDYTLYNQF